MNGAVQYSDLMSLRNPICRKKEKPHCEDHRERVQSRRIPFHHRHDYEKGAECSKLSHYNHAVNVITINERDEINQKQTGRREAEWNDALWKSACRPGEKSQE